MGLLSDRMGRKRAMLLGFTAANLGIILMTCVRQPLFMLAMAFVWGLSGQLYVLSHVPFQMKVSDDKSRDLLFSVSFGIFPLASTFGNFLAGYLPGLFSRSLGASDGAQVYQAVLLTCVISSFAVLVPIAFIREPKTDPKAESAGPAQAPRRSLWATLSRPLTLKLALPNLVIGFGAATLIPYMNVFFVERFHMSDRVLGLLFSLSALLTGLACFLGPRLVGNLGGKVRAVVLGQATSLVFLLVIGFSPYVWLAVIGFLVRAALMNMVAPLFDAFAMEQTPAAEHGAVNSVRNLAWNFGWAVGPYVSGVVQQHYGFTPLFVNTAVLYAIGIALTWAFFRPKAQPDLAPAVEAP